MCRYIFHIKVYKELPVLFEQRGQGKTWIAAVAMTGVLGTTSLFALDYDHIIAEARAGKYPQALKALKQLYRENPHNQKLLYDYITVLGWAGHDRQAVALSSSVDMHHAPAYLIQNVAKSARNIHDYDQAVKRYIMGAKRFPNNPDFQIGLAQSLADIDKNELAIRVMQKAIKRFPRNNRLQILLAALYEKEKNYFDAMRIYQRLIDDPKLHDEVVVKLVGTLRRQGMVFVAQKYIRENPELFRNDPALDTSLHSDQAAYQLRWFANGYHADGDTREGIAALKKIRRVIQKLHAQNGDIRANRRLQNAYFDQLVALHALHRDRDAAAVYRYLAKYGIKMPPYVLTAAGESFLNIRKPRLAQKLFKAALRKQPHDFKTQSDLFYAYSDAYDMHRALRYARALDRREPPKIWDRNHLKKIPNPRKENSVMLDALAKAYSGYLPDAIGTISRLVDHAPMNQWYREELGKQYYYSGRYDDADHQFDILLAYNPRNFEAHKGKLLNAIATNRYREARMQLREITRQFPYRHEDLAKLRKAYRNATAGYMTLESSYNQGNKTSLGQNSDGYHLRGTLFSPLLSDFWRLYLSADQLHSRFSEDRLDNRRYAIGTTYTDHQLEANARIAYNSDIIKRAAPAVDLTWHLNDFWSIGGGYAWFWDGTPDRAILNGIRANHFRLTLGYRHDNFTTAQLQLTSTGYSDGNRAQAVDLNMQTRLVYGPYYTLDGAIYTGAGANRLQNRVYYAPDQDSYAALALINRWTLYSLYERQIFQKVRLEIGKHYEKGYGAKTTGAVEIAQEWQYSDKLGFDFGFSRSRASYDGSVEYANHYYLNMNGSF